MIVSFRITDCSLNFTCFKMLMIMIAASPLIVSFSFFRQEIIIFSTKRFSEMYFWVRGLITKMLRVCSMNTILSLWYQFMNCPKNLNISCSRFFFTSCSMMLFDFTRTLKMKISERMYLSLDCLIAGLMKLRREGSFSNEVRNSVKLVNSDMPSNQKLTSC